MFRREADALGYAKTPNKTGNTLRPNKMMCGQKKNTVKEKGHENDAEKYDNDKMTPKKETPENRSQLEPTHTFFFFLAPIFRFLFLSFKFYLLLDTRALFLAQLLKHEKIIFF